MKKVKWVSLLLCAVCLLGCICNTLALGKQPAADPVRLRMRTQAAAPVCAEQMDPTLLRLQEKFWVRMDARQRRDLLQIVAEQEAQRLGIEAPAVCARRLEGNALGMYSDADQLITLDLEHLKHSDVKKVLSTVLHECYHAYQNRLVELYNRLSEDEKKLMLFQPAAQYAAEFANYNDGSRDYAAYSAQQCEIDCEAYAAQAVLEYENSILTYKENRGRKP